MLLGFLREGHRLGVRLLRVLGPRAVIAVCLLLSVSVVIRAWRNLWFAENATVVNGTVVRQDEIWAADWERSGASRAEGPQLAPARRVFQAVVGFTVGDRQFEVPSARRGVAHVYPLGSRQAVVFPPGQPQRARLRSELPDFWAQAGLLLMGTIVGAGTLRWWWQTARRRRPRFTRRWSRPGFHW